MHLTRPVSVYSIDCPQLAFPKLSYKSQFRGGFKTDRSLRNPRELTGSFVIVSDHTCK